jgi:hypothetical protein
MRILTCATTVFLNRVRQCIAHARNGAILLEHRIPPRIETSSCLHDTKRWLTSTPKIIYVDVDVCVLFGANCSNCTVVVKLIVQFEHQMGMEDFELRTQICPLSKNLQTEQLSKVGPYPSDLHEIGCNTNGMTRPFVPITAPKPETAKRI